MGRWLGAALLALLACPTWADAAIPPSMHGIWAAPACERDAPTAVWFSHGTVDIDPDGAVYRQYEDPDPVNGWLRLDDGSGGPPAWLRQPEPERLRLAIAGIAAGPGSAPAPPQGPDPGEGWDVTEFVRCPGLPSSYAVTHGEGIAVLSGLDGLRGICSAGADNDDPACAKGLFRVADLSGNGELSVAELARMGRVAVWFTAIASGEAATGDLLAAFAGAVAITPVLAKAIVSSFDYDDSGAVSLSELTQNREALLETAGAQPLGGGARPKIQALMEQLKTAEQMLRMMLQ